MKVLVTAGPTFEPIDPVRFVGNYSSGKMGIAIAEEFAARGADVVLVKGPTPLTASHPNVMQVPVQTAEQMLEACRQYFADMDVVVFAAAVADYKPKTISEIKIKKSEPTFTIEMVKTVDVAATLGELKKDGQILIGFALETNNELEHAAGKLKKKKLDFIVLNSLQDEGAGFRHDTNKITIIDKQGNVVNFDLKPKTEVAKDIVDYTHRVKTGL